MKCVFIHVCVYILLLGYLIRRNAVSGEVINNAKSPSEKMECKILKYLSIMKFSLGIMRMLSIFLL